VNEVLPLHLAVADRRTATSRPSFGLTLDRSNRRLSLSSVEAEALTALGTEGLRRSRARGADRDELSWAALVRLARPLDDALAVLHHSGSPLHLRAGADAVALVLARCARVERSWWAWTPADWRDLIGDDATAFRASVAWPASTTVRPFVIALAHVLGGFDDFHLIGMFDRLYLAGLVFGQRPSRTRWPRSPPCWGRGATAVTTERASRCRVRSASSCWSTAAR
jgi:hypothetical protein